ncbi:hypothetical protein XELAEV_18040657mg [Xenopus laevis]|uniref:Ig-like domain-containing protein n=1 Tax=Xenopus laevis TaxID=8355 RepID=A0A974CAH3_XENLA|nr:hypothetical protein XELAEV_18040657mg [Xenopus laevis]
MRERLEREKNICCQQHYSNMMILYLLFILWTPFLLPCEYPPIPTPVIETTLDEESTDLCHLHCSVPSNSTNLRYIWIYSDKGTVTLYANSSTISVLLTDKPRGAQFLCLVQNPSYSNGKLVLLYQCWD